MICRTLYAIEKNRRRFNELNDNLKSAGVKCARTLNEDFLETSIPCEEIEYILLDPTCSGSGIRHRNEEHEPIDEERLARLTALQIRMVTFALTHFPRVKRVTYSTCSIHSQENEHVVEAILDQHGDTFQVRWRSFDCSSHPVRSFSCWISYLSGQVEDKPTEHALVYELRPARP